MIPGEQSRKDRRGEEAHNSVTGNRGGGGPPIAGQEVPNGGAARGDGRGEQRGCAHRDQRGRDQCLAEVHQAAERIGPDLGWRQQEAGDRLEDRVREVELPKHTIEHCGAVGFLLGIGQSVWNACRNAGPVGRLYDGVQVVMKSF